MSYNIIEIDNTKTFPVEFWRAPERFRDIARTATANGWKATFTENGGTWSLSIQGRGLWFSLWIERGNRLAIYRRESVIVTTRTTRASLDYWIGREV